MIELLKSPTPQPVSHQDIPGQPAVAWDDENNWRTCLAKPWGGRTVKEASSVSRKLRGTASSEEATKLLDDETVNRFGNRRL